MRIWQFKTRNFRVELSAEYEANPDLSWDDTGEVRDNLESGIWGNYCFAVKVYGPHGEALSADYLGNSIYADPADFRDHIGARGQWGSYFTDMVRTAIGEAREALADMQAIRIRRAA